MSECVMKEEIEIKWRIAKKISVYNYTTDTKTKNSITPTKII